MTALSSVETEILLRQKPGSTVYLAGIGGCGMSGLAHLLLDLGHQVVGSDLVANEETRQLSARGARVHVGHSAGQLRSAAPAAVVYTPAIRADNPELQEANRLGLPIIRRAVFLAALV